MSIFSNITYTRTLYNDEATIDKCATTSLLFKSSGSSTLNAMLVGFLIPMGIIRSLSLPKRLSSFT